VRPSREIAFLGREIRLGGCLICLSVSHLMRRELCAEPISVASIRQCDPWDFRDAVSSPPPRDPAGPDPRRAHSFTL